MIVASLVVAFADFSELKRLTQRHASVIEESRTARISRSMKIGSADDQKVVFVQETKTTPKSDPKAADFTTERLEEYLAGKWSDLDRCALDSRTKRFVLFFKTGSLECDSQKSTKRGSEAEVKSPRTVTRRSDVILRFRSEANLNEWKAEFASQIRTIRPDLVVP